VNLRHSVNHCRVDFIRLGRHLLFHERADKHWLRNVFLGDSINASALRFGILNWMVPDQTEAETPRSREGRDAPQKSIAAAKRAVYMSDSADLEEMPNTRSKHSWPAFEPVTPEKHRPF
jgi:enoyl-CoA hydratase/carnithine racemase